MRLLTGLGLLALGIVGLRVLLSPSMPVPKRSPRVVLAQSLEGLPYHPIVYHLDLTVLAYQLYSQSLVWPFDPYYEDLDPPQGRREYVMDAVRQFAADRGVATADAWDASYRGPPGAAGLPDDARHDPVLYQYSRVYPWSPSLTNAAGRWIEYRTPDAITSRIGQAWVCSRPRAGALGDVRVDALQGPRGDTHADAPDVLLAFEGGIGDKGEPGEQVSQSLMGFALVRYAESGDYDIHIALRGARSGDSRRRVLGLSC